MITRNNAEIVKEKALGGVFAWNLGRDTFDWANLLHVGDEANKLAKDTVSATTQEDLQTSSIPAPSAAQDSCTTLAT